MKKCNICGLEFNNHHLLANHIRWKHKDNSNYLNNLSLKTKSVFNEKYGDWILEKINCPNCNLEFEIRYRPKKRKEKYFCSQSCAASFNNKKRTLSEDSKEKISKKIRNLWKDETYRSKIICNLKKDEKRYSSKGEREIRNILKNFYIVLAHRNIKLDESLRKAIDIQLIEKNTFIEYDGIWHFKKVKENHNFSLQQKKDKLLNNYCLVNKIKLIRIKEELYYSNKAKMIKDILNIIENKDIGNYFLY